MQSSQSCMLELLASWLARCMQSSHGTFTEVLRKLLWRRDEDEVDAGFGVGVEGGAMAFFSLEARTRSVTEKVEGRLQVSSVAVEQSISSKVSSRVISAYATAQAEGPGKQINASWVLLPGVMLRNYSATDSEQQYKPRRPSTRHGQTSTMLGVGLSKQTWLDAPLKFK